MVYLLRSTRIERHGLQLPNTKLEDELSNAFRNRWQGMCSSSRKCKKGTLSDSTPILPENDDRPSQLEQALKMHCETRYAYAVEQGWPGTNNV